MLFWTGDALDFARLNVSKKLIPTRFVRVVGLKHA
jgi:hypothetical protein